MSQGRYAPAQAAASEAVEIAERAGQADALAQAHSCWTGWRSSPASDLEPPRGRRPPPVHRSGRLQRAGARAQQPRDPATAAGPVDGGARGVPARSGDLRARRDAANEANAAYSQADLLNRQGRSPRPRTARRGDADRQGGGRRGAWGWCCVSRVAPSTGRAARRGGGSWARRGTSSRPSTNRTRPDRHRAGRGPPPRGAAEGRSRRWPQRSRPPSRSAQSPCCRRPAGARDRAPVVLGDLARRSPVPRRGARARLAAGPRPRAGVPAGSAAQAAEGVEPGEAARWSAGPVRADSLGVGRAPLPWLTATVAGLKGTAHG